MQTDNLTHYWDQSEYKANIQYSTKSQNAEQTVDMNGSW